MSALDAIHFLDEDGNFDATNVYKITNKGVGGADRVTADEATYIREQLLAGRIKLDIAREIGRCPETLRQHAHGDVEYENGDVPDCPPVEYAKGGWRVKE